jgi:cytoskeletal protein RodZ
MKNNIAAIAIILLIIVFVTIKLKQTGQPEHMVPPASPSSSPIAEIQPTPSAKPEEQPSAAPSVVNAPQFTVTKDISGRKVQMGDKIRVEYSIRNNKNGALIIDSDAPNMPKIITVGDGKTLPFLEMHATRLSIGASAKILLPPAEGVNVRINNMAFGDFLGIPLDTTLLIEMKVLQLIAEGPGTSDPTSKTNNR